MNVNIEALFREARRAQPGGNRNRRYPKTPTWKKGMEYFCQRCGGELIDTGESTVLVCRECGLETNQLVFSTFNSSNLPPNANRPVTRNRGGGGGKGKGIATYAKQEPEVKRQQDIRTMVNKVYQNAGSLRQNPPEDIVELVAKISDARDYTPRESPEKYPMGTIVEGRDGVEYEVQKGKSVDGGKTWKLANKKQKVPHRLVGIYVHELVGIIRYILGTSMETVEEFWKAASNKPPKNGFVVLRKLMKDDGVSKVLSPLYRNRRDKADERMSSYYPENRLFSKDEKTWIRQRMNRVIDAMTIPPELAVRGSLVLFDLLQTGKCIHLGECLKRFRMTKRQWDEFTETLKTTKFKSDLKSIQP